MPTDSSGAPRALPARPHLRHLKAQASDLLDAGAATSVADAQYQVARRYGFASWPKLKAHVESLAAAAVAAPMPIDSLTPDALLDAIATFLAGQDLLRLADIRDALGRELAAAGPAALVQLHERLIAEADWDFYPADPLAKRVHRVLADRLLEPDSTLTGIEHVHAVAQRPVVIVCNHLSYADANLLEILLQRAGGTALADRLIALAGPKVYTSRKRRFSSLCFGTIRTPQNSALSTGEAVMSPRETASAARRSIDAAHGRLRRGDALLVFAEGTRSRTMRMQPLLAGAARYLDGPEACVLPVGIVGTEAMFPIDEDALHTVRVDVSVGRLLDGASLRSLARGDRQVMMDAIGLAVAELLPAAYRGAYGNGDAGLDAARRVLADIRHGAGAADRS